MSMNLGSNMGATAPNYPPQNSDPQNPASYLNSAYQAYKFNPGATQQALQAAGQAQQQGQPTDLKGLAALAAAHSQQFAKQAQQSAQAQGMPPSVLQQILQSSGIMNQLQPQQALAQQPPEAQGLGALQPDDASLPDAGGMATGGLVALARGGSIDDPEVDNDAFWDEDTGAGPDLGGFLKRHVPSRDELLHGLGLPTEAGIEAHRKAKDVETQQYYGTTTPSPSKLRELEASGIPPTAPLPLEHSHIPPAEPPVEDYHTMPMHRLVSGIGSFLGLGGHDKAHNDPVSTEQKPVLDELDRINNQPPKQETNPPPPPTPEVPLSHAEVKGTDEYGNVIKTTPEVNPKATKIAEELQPTVIEHNSTVPNPVDTTSDPRMVETQLRANLKAQKPGTDAFDQAEAQLDEHVRRQDAANDTGDTSGYIHPAAHQEGIASLAPGESMGVPDKRPRGIIPDEGPTGIEGQLAQLEAMRGTYQLPPEIMDQLAHHAQGAKEDKWLMALTGLGAGFLGSSSPFKTQALGQGLMTGLGMYGRGSQEQGKAEDQMLAAQLAQAKAPYEAHTKAVDDLIRMQEARGKMLAGMHEKQFEIGAKDKMNQDRIRSNQQIADKKLAAMGEKGNGQLTEAQLLHATYEAEQAKDTARKGHLDVIARTRVPTAQDVADANRIGEAAYRNRLGPYYDQVMASTGGGAATPMPATQGNSQTRGLVVPGKFTPIGQ